MHLKRQVQVLENHIILQYPVRIDYVFVENKINVKQFETIDTFPSK